MLPIILLFALLLLPQQATAEQSCYDAIDPNVIVTIRSYTFIEGEEITNDDELAELKREVQSEGARPPIVEIGQAGEGYFIECQHASFIERGTIDVQGFDERRSIGRGRGRNAR